MRLFFVHSMKYSVYAIIFFFLHSCLPPGGQVPISSQFSNQSSEQFQQYWFDGKAEITTYKLQQARYGEIREGNAVMVFVSEDFLVGPQVKKEFETNLESCEVLKLNLLKKFTTGVYDYNLMSSMFTPIHQKQVMPPLKVSSSSQEWCGQSWLQFNQRTHGYEVAGFSYFQLEGDQREVLQNVQLEDGLWNQIRLAPELIQEGKFMFVPSAQYLRLSHQEIKAYQAILKKKTFTDTLGIKKNRFERLTIDYPLLYRKLEIIYESSFPHRIKSWSESYPSGFDQNSPIIKTTASLSQQIKSDYWNKNNLKDSTLRKKLQLTF